MNGRMTSIQPPGLMKMRLMHHQEHHLGHQAPKRLVVDVPACVQKGKTKGKRWLRRPGIETGSPPWQGGSRGRYSRGATRLPLPLGELRRCSRVARQVLRSDCHRPVRLDRTLQHLGARRSQPPFEGIGIPTGKADLFVMR